MRTSITTVADDGASCVSQYRRLSIPDSEQSKPLITHPLRLVDTLESEACNAFNAGRLVETKSLLKDLLELEPDCARHHHLLGRVHKYQRAWQASLASHLRALAFDPGHAAALWDAGIAATAIGDWSTARYCWQRYGLDVANVDGPIDDDFGLCAVRLQPWASGEVSLARRIGPARARILELPLPHGGHRHGDIVLIDGERVRWHMHADERLPVFDALQRLQRSTMQTCYAVVEAPARADLDALLAAQHPGVEKVVDWTKLAAFYDLQRTYGVPWRRYEPRPRRRPRIPRSVEPDWLRVRDIGIAASEPAAAMAMLAQWRTGHAGRIVRFIRPIKARLGEPPDGLAWWSWPHEGHDETDETGDDDCDRVLP
jgi:hypothetical protein